MEGFRYLLLYLSLSLAGSCKGKPVELTQTLEHDLEEEDILNSRLEKFLGSMKEDFLRMLNLSGVPQEQRRIQPPPFMMELYNKYATDKSSIPRSDVIRSFLLQDVTQSATSENRTAHRLLFNVSVPHFEEVTLVQLRLFKLWERGQPAYDDTFTSINVYDVAHKQSQENLCLLDRRDLSDPEPSWEAFDVTSAVHGWLESRYGVGELEVEVERRGCGSFKGGGYNISLNLQDSTSPVLIVFSDDIENRKRQAKSKAIEMMSHEDESFLLKVDALEDYDGEVHLDRRPRRRKRQAQRNYCRRTSLRVNFKDIGWDQWIVAPPEYEAYECKGVCSFPLTNDVTPSKHAIIQTLMHLSNPKKANKACCVPTKLDPITVMYQDNGVITVRHLYEEMKVAKCGCR
ncbi:growth/differentiation factor 2 [Pygocentrus nattereri]|uniref:TGF-beta family profile domain-containing protein n=1 Tax=Pygocentrus nattereri TaxID=42514 RepID=A0A3B4D2E0_PYGNA|nr:growth/differentiation factor 2 [Pygocentrus nattereri]